jgi:hypothetical protein
VRVFTRSPTRDQRNFDQITRRLATATNRRSVVRGLAAGLFGAAGLRATTSAAPSGKTTICHWDATLGIYQQISVTTKDFKGHATHDHDILTPEFTSPANCGGCGTVCAAPANGTATCTAGRCGVSCDAGYASDGIGGCQPTTPHVCSGLASPNPCFERDGASCNANGTCNCGTDLQGNLTCYENAYCNSAGQRQCASNSDCEAIGFPSGSVCFSAENCCGANTTGCTTPCPVPVA